MAQTEQGEWVMARTEKVLDDTPLTAAQTLGVVDLISAQKALGSGAHMINLVEGEVSIGAPRATTVVANAAQFLGSHDGDGRKWRYCLVQFPFTLHPPKGERQYKKVMFQVALEQGDVLAYDLFPNNISHEEKTEKTLTISPDFKFTLLPGIDANFAGKYVSTLSATLLQPTITAYGNGEQQFSWQFQAPDKQYVRDGTRYVFALLKLPETLNTVIGSVTFQAVMEKKIFNVWEVYSLRSHNNPEPFRLSLPVVPSSNGA